MEYKIKMTWFNAAVARVTLWASHRREAMASNVLLKRLLCSINRPFLRVAKCYLDPTQAQNISFSCLDGPAGAAYNLLGLC